VHDNFIRMATGWTGIVQDVDSSTVVFTGRNNRFTNNKYEMKGSDRYFAWMNQGDVSAAAWRNWGQDVNGTFTVK
jgi:hypothetical protein